MILAYSITKIQSIDIDKILKIGFAVLLGGEIKPNVLTMKLNINAGRLQKQYGILYKHTRGHTGRKIQLILEEK